MKSLYYSISTFVLLSFFTSNIQGDTMSENDHPVEVNPQRTREETQKIEVVDILEERPLEREKSSGPPPIPKRRSPQSLSQIIRRLQGQGWTKIQFRFECSRVEKKTKISMAIWAEFFYVNMGFEIVTFLDNNCQSAVKLVSSDGSSQKQRTFTAQEILGQGRREDQKTIIDLEKRILKKLLRFLDKIRVEDSTETSTSLGLILDVLTGHFSWQLKHIFCNDPFQNTRSIEGSYAISQSEEKGPKALLKNLRETIIRGIDPLYTLLSLILRHATKRAIAKDLSEITEEERNLIVHSKTKIRIAKQGSLPVLVIFAAQPKKPST